MHVYRKIVVHSICIQFPGATAVLSVIFSLLDAVEKLSRTHPIYIGQSRSSLPVSADFIGQTPGSCMRSRR